MQCNRRRRENEPKIKTYTREDGSFSGEAPVVIFKERFEEHFKEDSVTLALNLVDEAELRLGDTFMRIRVQQAKFGHDHQQAAGGQGRGEMKAVNKKEATKGVGKTQWCGLQVHSLLNQPHDRRGVQDIGRLGTGG